MIAVLMSIGLSSFAGTKTNTTSSRIGKVNVPANLIIKQSITFDDGKTIIVFYEKEGETCKLYSTSNVSKYGISDLWRVKSTNFEKTNHAEGKCYATKSVTGLIALAKGFLK